MFEQRAAAQKCCGWLCNLDNTAIAVNLLPAMAGNLTSTVKDLVNGLDLPTLFTGIRATGMETTAGRRVSRIG